MNRIYRVVWSKAQHCWHVASEFARSAGKGGRALAVLSLGALSGLYGLDSEAAAGSATERSIAGNPGLYVNDSNDSGCVFVHDTGVSGDMGWKYDGNNSNCKPNDKATQTGRVLFYGTGSQADGTNSLTLGNELYVNGGRIGLNNKIDGSNSLAIGNVGTDALGNPTGTRATGVDSVSIGNNAVASQQNALALGTGAQAQAQDGVAIGSGSIAQTKAGVAGYVPVGASQAQVDAINATGSTLGAVAVGDAASGKFRQITGLAAGTQDSDAVNVAQLKGLVGSATADGVMYDDGSHNTVTLGGNTYDNSTHTGGTTITNLANGVKDSDAVNVSQLNELANTPLTFVGNAGSVQKKLGEAMVIQGTASTAGSYSGNNLRTEVDGAGNLQLLMADDPVFNSVTTGNTRIDGNGLTINGGPSVTFNGIDAGYRKIINVAPGDISANSSEAVNGSQLYSTNQQVEQNTTDISNVTNTINNYSNGTAGPVQRTGTDQLSLIAAGGDAYNPGNAQVLTNVAQGAVSPSSVDAVNGSQLYGLANSTANAMGGGSTVNPDGSISAPTYYVDGTTVNNVGDAITHIDGRVTQNTTNITSLQQDALQWNDALGAYDASHGSGDAQKITHVAAGDISADSTDAVNGSQLNATNQQVDANTNKITNLDGRVTNVEGDVTNLQGDVTNLDGRVTNIYDTGTKYFHANSTGTDSVASGVDSVAIGMGALSSHDGSVALGAGSVANGSTLGHEAYLVGGTATGEVNIGDRRITGVSAGADDTDAVNVSQLKATTAASVADAVMYDNSTHNSITLGGGTYDNSTHTGGTTITNVANGVNDSDAVNMSQLNETNTNVANVDNRVTDVKGDVTNLDGRVSNIYDTGTKYFHANSTGTDSVASGVDSVAIGMGALSSHDGSVALGAGSVANGSTLGHEAYLVGGTATGEVNIGDRRVTGLSAGADDTDAVNVAQLKAITSGAVADAVMYDNSSHDSITLGGATYNSVTRTGGTKITNVARGENDSDAVNMSQLNETNAQVSNIDGRVTTVEGSITSINNGGGIKYFHANSTKADSVASGADSVAVGPNAKAGGKGSVAMGESASATADGSVALGQGASDNGRGAESYIGKYSNAANASVGTVSVGNATTGETRTLSNVADGKQATDAVNLRQLDGAVAESKQYTDDSIQNVNTQVANVTSNVSNLDNRVTHVEGDMSKVQNGTDGMFQVNNTSNLPKPKPTGRDSVAGGAGAEAAGASSVAIGTQSKATGENSVAMGNGASASASNSAAVGAGSVADRAGSVSVGSAGNERQITNVAAGTAPTDAVNFGQLQQSMGDISNQFYDYTDSRYNALRHDLKKQDDILSAGIAGAMAMATLPQPYVPGASMAAVGLGNYRGQGALAVGVSRISDNGKWVTKLQATSSTQGDAGVAAGVGYQW
ncbi:YadA-like family protein [Pseudomonas sp. NY15181]|uniref:YadA-like family protein n=1 Tax=Pseudomonas sp. NY15181 TaxID=3400349 RepID=UPI003A835F59